MKRFEIIDYYNNFFLLPALYFNYERGWYCYIMISWLRWGVSYRVYNKESEF